MSDIPNTEKIAVAKIAAALKLALEGHLDEAEKSSNEAMFNARLKRFTKAFEEISKST